ncbi:hypothetical protein [uncultured Thiodictyon sp.]|jgi:hypothetical protein|uniref:hypothetical protein n=1 Tax=uncultured Thiodictyon sp. TaxID=1846217 RepID=UPI0025E515E5|nr:hypothetical protein [uncultured Thiodictyon sp.]
MDGSIGYLPALGIAARADSPSAASAAGNLTWASFDADLAVVRDWLGSLRAAGVRQAGPALLLALAGLRRATLSPSRRLSMLRLLKGPVRKTCAGLPKPWSGPGQPPDAGADGACPRGVTLEQRLYRLMFQNLHQALVQLDRGAPAQDERPVRRRDWALHNLFRFCARQLRYAALWGCPVPVDTWRDLHDLYVHLMVRRVTGAAPGRPLQRAPSAVDATFEYKQLLLFGLAEQRAGRGVRSSAVLAGLARWAGATLLEDPHVGLHGETGLYVVEVGQDQPPRRHPGPLDAGLRGWVLLPPAEFFEQLEQARSATVH